MVVQLLYFPGCPNVDGARALLQVAIREVASPITVEEVDVTSQGTPPELRGWGSPTILIDGKDVAEEAPSGASCRLYKGSPTPGVPSLDSLLRALKNRG